MNKRIRKKKCRGEFQELAFNLTAAYAKLTPETADEFVDKILDRAGELNISCGGSFELDHCDLFAVTGRINTNETERKEKFLAFIRELPGVEKVEAGEFIDAWYTPITSEECSCEGEHHHDDCSCGH